MMRLSLNILDHFLANNNNATTMAKLFWTFGLSGVVNGNGMMMVVVSHQFCPFLVNQNLLLGYF